MPLFIFFLLFFLCLIDMFGWFIYRSARACVVCLLKRLVCLLCVLIIRVKIHLDSCTCPRKMGSLVELTLLWVSCPIKRETKERLAFRKCVSAAFLLSGTMSWRFYVLLRAGVNFMAGDGEDLETIDVNLGSEGDFE